jgi:hypothetical protein
MENFGEEEVAFQGKLAESFAQKSVRECLQTVDQLVDAFIDLKGSLQQNEGKRVSLLVHLQLLQAKHNSLSEQCFADQDALAYFFFLHERMAFLYQSIAEAPARANVDEVVEAAEEKAEEEVVEKEVESSVAVVEDSPIEFECPVCYEDFTCSSECIQLTSCGHRYCKQVRKLAFTSRK